MEFKRCSGKAIPYKFFGFDSLYDFLSNIPDVVRLVRGAGGNTLLLGVPDEKTLHVAKMVGNQRDNIEGFNRRTADFVSRLDHNTRKMISNLSGYKNKEVSDLVKNQIRELLAMDNYLDGIQLAHLPFAYDKEFGYKIDWEEFGFKTLEDFCLNGLQDVVDIDLDLTCLKIVEKGMVGFSKPTNQVPKIPKVLVTNIKQLMMIEKAGVPVTRFKTIYEEHFEYINILNLGFRTMLEFCLFLPDILRVSQSEAGEHICLPAPDARDAMTTMRSVVVSRVAGNVARLLEGQQAGVEMEVLVRGYGGLHGDLTRVVRELQLSSVEQLLQQCEAVCQLQTGPDGRLMVVPVPADPLPSIPPDILSDLHQILPRHPAGAALTEIPQLYRQSFGRLLCPVSLGFNSLVEMMKTEGSGLVLRGDKVWSEKEEEQEGEIYQAGDGEKGRRQSLGVGWWRIISWSSEEEMICQQSSLTSSLARLEAEMEEFYNVTTSGGRVRPGSARRGDLVAALHSDLAWHRARVLQAGPDWLLLHYLDWGWLTRVRLDTVRSLPTAFRELPWQAVTLSWRKVKLVAGTRQDWEEMVREGRLRLRLVERDQRGVWSGEIRIKLTKRS